MRWQKQVFVHTRLSRTYLAIARLSCSVLLQHYFVTLEPTQGKMFVWLLLAPINKVHTCFRNCTVVNAGTL